MRYSSYKRYMCVQKLGKRSNYNRLQDTKYTYKARYEGATHKVFVQVLKYFIKYLHLAYIHFLLHTYWSVYICMLDTLVVHNIIYNATSQPKELLIPKKHIYQYYSLQELFRFFFFFFIIILMLYPSNFFFFFFPLRHKLYSIIELLFSTQQRIINFR